MSLKSINKDIERQFSEMGLAFTDEMYHLWLTYGKIDFNQKAFLDEATRITVEGMIEATTISLGTLQIASVEGLSEYYLFSNYKGGTLSEALRNSAKEASVIMEATMKEHIKATTNWKKLTKSFTDKKLSKGDLPKYLTELNQASYDVLKDPTNKLANKRLKAKLKAAKAKILKLEKSGAPTKALKNSYKKVIRAVEKGNKPALQKSMDYAMQRKAIYNNERIARTEMARAQSLAFQRQIQEEGVETVQVLLDSRHNIIDECDMITGANMYGLGKGVYPADRAPMPPYHPNCVCSVIPSTKDSKGARFSNTRAKAYLSKLPKNRRDAMLQGGNIKDWRQDLKGYDGELDQKPKALPKKYVKKAS